MITVNITATLDHNMKQAEAEVVPSSSLVELRLRLGFRLR